MIDKNTTLVLLFDCYQSLLTDKQRQMMDLYYNQDLSLAEIAEELEISRQGVYDHIKRTNNLLHQYEKKMGLLQIFQRQSRLIQRMKQSISKIESQISAESCMEDSKEDLRQIKESLEQLYQISSS